MPVSWIQQVECDIARQHKMAVIAAIDPQDFRPDADARSQMPTDGSAKRDLGDCDAIIWKSDPPCLQLRGGSRQLLRFRYLRQNRLDTHQDDRVNTGKFADPACAAHWALHIWRSWRPALQLSY